MLALSGLLCACSLLSRASLPEECNGEVFTRCDGNILTFCAQGLDNAFSFDCGDAVCNEAAGSCGFCGDGVLIASFEECEDGNNTNGDGCDAFCSLEFGFCGNGLVERAAGELCDDGNNNDGDDCNSDCTFPNCGNGVIDADQGEECDLTSPISTACSPFCTECGDTEIDPGESCDDGNLFSGDGCDAFCQFEP
jgi:cysteine-rich repeat protein